MGRFVLAAGVASLVLLCVAAASGQQPKDGEQIMNAACGSCHDTTSIQTAARNDKEWTETVDQMVARGASLSDADRPILIAYLARAFGPMPDESARKRMREFITAASKRGLVPIISSASAASMPSMLGLKI